MVYRVWAKMARRGVEQVFDGLRKRITDPLSPGRLSRGATRFELATLTLAKRQGAFSIPLQTRIYAGQRAFPFDHDPRCLTLFLSRLRDFCGIGNDRRVCRGGARSSTQLESQLASSALPPAKCGRRSNSRPLHESSSQDHRGRPTRQAHRSPHIWACARPSGRMNGSETSLSSMGVY